MLTVRITGETNFYLAECESCEVYSVHCFTRDEYFDFISESEDSAVHGVPEMGETDFIIYGMLLMGKKIDYRHFVCGRKIEVFSGAGALLALIES